LDAHCCFFGRGFRYLRLENTRQGLSEPNRTSRDRQTAQLGFPAYPADAICAHFCSASDASPSPFTHARVAADQGHDLPAMLNPLPDSHPMRDFDERDAVIFDVLQRYFFPTF
jgi:hypothetical protein